MYSYGHETLDIHSKEYWDFSYPDMKYDIKANVDFIFKETNKKIHYIACSNGAVSYLACMSDPDKKWFNEKANILEKIHIMYALCPVIYTVIETILNHIFRKVVIKRH